ncbi:MAG: DUF2207 family protein [Oscillospiraceae bacterium]
MATGLLAGCLGLALVCCLVQCLLGLLVLFGGRRSEEGRQTLAALLGLRRYLCTVDRKQLHRILRQNPGYYYDMAPYALALGIDRQFARRFDRMRLPACPWLVTDFPLGNSARGWYPCCARSPGPSGATSCRHPGRSSRQGSGNPGVKIPGGRCTLPAHTGWFPRAHGGRSLLDTPR